MKVLCITPWFPKHKEDKTYTYILDSVEALIAIGHEVVVIVTKPWYLELIKIIKKKLHLTPSQVNNSSFDFPIYTCTHLYLPSRFFRALSIVFYKKKVAKFIKKIAIKYKSQIIHAHTEWAGVPVANVGIECGVPTVLTLHGTSMDATLYKGFFKKVFFENTLSNASRVVLVGDSIVQFYQKFVKSSEHFRVIYNGFRLPSQNISNVKKSWPDHEIRFISVSNLYLGKGIEENLYALAKLKNNGMTKWSYEIIGYGRKHERDMLKRLVDDLGLNDYVSFYGPCNHNIVYQQLQNADVFILPSYKEAFGIAYLEAMSCGLLAVGVEGQGPQAFIKHKETGLLVPARDVEALSETLAWVLKNKIEVQNIAENGQILVWQSFTWLNHAAQLTKIFHEII